MAKTTKKEATPPPAPPKPVVPAKEIKQEWIFKAPNDHKMVVRGGILEDVHSPSGKIHQRPIKPIKIIFKHGTFVLNAAVAKRYGQDLEYFADLMVNHPLCGNTYKYIWGPNHNPDEGLARYAKRCDEAAEEKFGVLSQGVKTSR